MRWDHAHSYFNEVTERLINAFIFIIYKLAFLFPQMLLESVLNITAPSVGRFGSAIASLADLNGDGLRDVAVGAPLEDDNSGAVYIFLGDGHSGIRSTFSQVRELDSLLSFKKICT